MGSILTANRADLLTAVKRASTCVQHHNTLQILSHLRLQAEGGRLTVTGSDLETEISATCDCQGDDLLTTVPARKLAQILSGLQSPEIKISLGDARATLSAGSGRYQLATMSGGDFPRLDADQGQIDTLTLDAQALADLLDQVRYASSRDDVRYYLRGIHLDGRRGPKLVFTATDGHRLGRAELPLDDGRQVDRDLIIPNAAAESLRKLLPGSGTVDLAIWDRGLRLTAGDVEISAKLIDGKYPEIDRAIPRDNPLCCTVDRLALELAIKRVEILANEYKGVRLAFSHESLSLIAANADQEEAAERLECDYTGDPIIYGVRSSYLLDALSAVGGERVQLRLRDVQSACLLQRDGAEDRSLHVLMPMRL